MFNLIICSANTSWGCEERRKSIRRCARKEEKHKKVCKEGEEAQEGEAQGDGGSDKDDLILGSGIQGSLHTLVHHINPANKYIL